MKADLHICHVGLPKPLQNFGNLPPWPEWIPNEGDGREPDKVKKETPKEGCRRDEEVNERHEKEADQLHVWPQHCGPVGDQAVGVDHPWQPDYCDPRNSRTRQQSRPDPDADKEEGKEKAEGDEDEDLGQPDAEEYDPEGND